MSAIPLDGHPVIEFTTVGHTYPGPPAVEALHPCDLRIVQGEYVTVVGPSGSGKSTLLNIIGLLDVPTRGTYLLDGIDTAAVSESSRAAMRGRRIGFVFQSFHLLPHRSALENVEVAMVYRRVPRRERCIRAEAVLRRVDTRCTRCRAGAAHHHDPRWNSDRVVPPRGGRVIRLHLGRRSHRNSIGRSRIASRDLFSEAITGILQRPARSILTALGTVLGVGAFIAVLGLTGTAASQIDTRFNELTATEVNIEDAGGQDSARVPLAFPRDADARIRRLNGVTSAGVYWRVRLGPSRPVQAVPLGSADGADAHTQVIAASSGVLTAVNSRFVQGRSLDDFHDQYNQQVAVLGQAAAARMGIKTLRTAPAIFIGGTAFTVIGIIEDVDRKPDLLMSVMVPRSTAERVWGPPADTRARMLVSTRLGAASQVAREAAVALRPEHPEYFNVVPPPDPRSLRSAVGDDLGQLFLVLAGVCLVIGAVGIANTTLVAVMERTSEIGLRRALGARGIHITLQFLTESAALGLLGGLAGTSIGTAVVVATALAKQWTPVLDPITLMSAPLLGLVTGLLAGLYPAWRASSIPPGRGPAPLRRRGPHPRIGRDSPSLHSRPRAPLCRRPVLDR